MKARERAASHPRLADVQGVFIDRFSGTQLRPGLPARRDFAELTAELTAANELDRATVSPDFRARHGPGLPALFTRWRPLLSSAARAECDRVLGAAGG
ncbi:hypothetical protein [Streptomyces sp. NPDC007172]|uniref:hypothetical protein n=1 Tax=Streptomyces sp. NPDC007172 TaxID=3364776 RepID=UPI0036C1F8ED